MMPLFGGVFGSVFGGVTSNDSPYSETPSLACSLKNNLNAGAAQDVISLPPSNDDFQKSEDIGNKDSNSQNACEKGFYKIWTAFCRTIIAMQAFLINDKIVTGTANRTHDNFSLNITDVRSFTAGKVESLNQTLCEYSEERKVKDVATMTTQSCKLLIDGLSTGFLIASSLLSYHLFVISGSLVTSACTFARQCAVYYNDVRDGAYFVSQINRLASYDTWMHDVKPSALSMASAGFYSTASHRDEVSCFSCGLTLNSWSRGMLPIRLHAQLSRGHCKYINDPAASGNIPAGNLSAPGRQSIAITPSQSAVGGSHQPLAEPPGIPLTQPSHLSQSIKPSHLSENDQRQSQYVSLFASLPEGIRNAITEVARTSGLSETPSADANARQEDHVRSEAFRLRTFSSIWQYSAIVQPADLAREGFFYTGVGDRVQCAFCKGILRNWERGDKPGELHAQNFTYCRFVQGHDVGNVPIFLSTPSTMVLNSSHDSTNITEDQLGIVLLSPKYPELAIEARRLLTFQTWPSNSTISQESLAKAGFFFAGVYDEVICFFCGVRVRDWRRKSDAWIEHAAKFPTCQYVIQAKGLEFVTQHTTVRGDAETAAAVFAVDPREIRARMDSQMVRCLLEMDYPAELIKEVLQRRLATVGKDFETSEDLLAEIFRYHDEKQTLTRNDPSRAEATVIVQPSIVRGPNERTASRDHNSPAVAAAAAAVSLGSEGQNAAQLQQLPTGAESIRTGHKQRLSPQEENRQLKTQLTCKICMEEEVAIVFLPCGHLVACAICSPALEKCPMCRVEIRGTARLNFSA